MNYFITFCCGIIFGLGLLLTGMYSPDIILSGLKIGAQTFRWDLYVTFATALGVTFLLFQFRRRMSKPLTQDTFQLPTKERIDWQLVVGAILFGIGWGVSGICPGPNVVGLALFHWPFYWINFAGIILGFLLTRFLLKKKGEC